MTEVTTAVVQILFGLVALTAGGELLVRGASTLAAIMRISSLVIGLTVVAFGTSAPELAVGVQAAFSGKTELAIGNAVGSNIFNILFVLGLSALITPLVVSSQLIRWDVPLMIFVSVLLLVFGWDGTLSRIDGVILFGGLLTYVAWSIRQSRRETQARIDEANEDRTPSLGARILVVNVAFIIGGLLLLGVGSRGLVSGSITIATMLGVSELIIGLTVVAVGTSLPEVVTSVVAAFRGERDIAVGNAVGSNIFNILCVLGLSSAIAPSGLEVGTEAIRFDIPVMITVAVACLPIFYTGHLISRWEGGLFFFYYVAYTTYLVLDTMQHEFSRTLGGVMVAFVIPLTTVTLLIATYRMARRDKSPSDSTQDGVLGA
ncbi:MAG: calcium/sodium antiporter [Planctomycetaceae bacterium]|nr:calcium/sodium antiporter [Planctomycetales bacterium]MCB9873252.1 calcium/sodium antiporter [Planctomycetaceae bacterium]MCB9939449.1 calcium/sodium antiporter [Planctomycetaceae bacterium]